MEIDFRNQPLRSYFDKSFSGFDDATFLALNEISPNCLETSQQEIKFEMPWDPRRKQHLKSDTICLTSDTKPSLFRSNHRSCLTRKQHQDLLRFFQNKQNHREVDATVIAAINRIQNDMNKEKESFQGIVRNYEESYKGEIYKFSKDLMLLYRKWYQQEIERILTKIPDAGYNTITALPQVQSNAWSKDGKGNVGEINVLAKEGTMLLTMNKSIEMKTLRHRFKNYCLDFNGTIHEETNVWLNKIQNERMQKPSIFLPLEALIFIVSAGTSIDLPSEVTLKIKSNPITGQKDVEFGDILPSRISGRNTYNFLLDNILKVFKAKCKEYSTDRSNTNTNLYIEAAHGYETSITYHAVEHSHYLQSIKEKFKAFNKSNKCFALLHWILKSTTEMNSLGLDILTPIVMPSTLCSTVGSKIAYPFIKLEYKPQFGCEILTKHELLKAWFHLKLLKASFNVEYASFLRISPENFETEVEEHLLLQQIEYNLSHYYQISMPKLLFGLEEFFMMLLKVPEGDYLMRYNSKYPDKLMLCAKNEIRNLNTFMLHESLKTNPTDLEFIVSNDYVPISDTVCSRRHMAHQVIPCHFYPAGQNKKGKNSPKSNIFNDRAIILKRLEEKEVKFNEMKLRYQRQVKKKKKQERKKRLNAIKNQQLKEKDEIEEEMKIDRQLICYSGLD